jgi:DNA-binding GntR family transcriptional regulator
MIKHNLARLQEAPRYKTAEEHAYAYLRELILSGELRGGERLNQDEIASRLQLSRMPVRQAILRLESEGLVVNRPNRGAVVTSLGPKAILELFEMRSVLEGLAVRLAVPLLDAAALEEVDRRTEALSEVEADPDAWIRRHDEFHDYVCRSAGRSRLSDQIRQLREQVAPFIRLYLTAYGAPEMPGFEHRAIASVLKGGDPARAETAMREHVLSTAQSVVEFVRANAAQHRIENGKDGT